MATYDYSSLATNPYPTQLSSLVPQMNNRTQLSPWNQFNQLATNNSSMQTPATAVNQFNPPVIDPLHPGLLADEYQIPSGYFDSPEFSDSISKYGNLGELNSMPTTPETPIDWAKMMGGVGMGLQGLSSLGNMYVGMKGLGLAKDQFDFNKQMANTNLANSVKSYNTELAHKAGMRMTDPSAYIASNKL